MPPRLLMSYSTLKHVWSQNSHTDLYGLKGSNLSHHWPRPTAQLGVVRCSLLHLWTQPTVTKCCTVVHCEVLHFTGCGWSMQQLLDGITCRMFSLYVVSLESLHVWPCSSKDVVPKYRTEMSPHGWIVSPALKLWNMVACQTSIFFPLFLFWGRSATCNYDIVVSDV